MNDLGFKPPLCIYRLNWGWWDESDDTDLQTHNSKFEPWQSEAVPFSFIRSTFNLILSIYPVFLMAMPVNMILVMYVILCILSYDFNKLTMLYIHVHISISMTNKSGLTFFLSIKYLSVCLIHYPSASGSDWLGHYVLCLCLRSEKNPKSNEGGRKTKHLRKKHLRKKKLNLYLEKLLRATK